ncbi:hypothetical protein DFH06DRAFT_1010611, partial [Mycena polygramma]
ISIIFTAGIRTNGRVEVENRVTKLISGPGKNLFQVFMALNERTAEQQRDEKVRVRDLRKYSGAFVLQTCFKQMQLAMFYEAVALQLPEGMRTWRSRNDFSNDSAYIGARFLLRLVQAQGLVPAYVIKVTHTVTRTIHIIVLFADGRYMCDCCMGSNLGCVCRHFLVVWLKIPGLPFHISLIRARRVLLRRCPVPARSNVT